MSETLLSKLCDLSNEQFAAKDAQIEALKARLAECEAAVDQAVALGEYLGGHCKGKMAERLKTAMSTSFWQERANYLAKLRADVTTAGTALQSIAAYPDKDASHFLEMTGSYSGFDEPGSVRAAREALKNMHLTHGY